MSCASLLLKKVKQHEECHAQGIVVRPWELLNVETDEVFLKLIIVRGEGRCKCFLDEVAEWFPWTITIPPILLRRRTRRIIMERCSFA